MRYPYGAGSVTRIAEYSDTGLLTLPRLKRLVITHISTLYGSRRWNYIRRIQFKGVLLTDQEESHRALKTGLGAGGADFCSYTYQGRNAGLWKGMATLQTLVEGVRLARKIKTYG